MAEWSDLRTNPDCGVAGAVRPDGEDGVWRDCCAARVFLASRFAGYRAHRLGLDDARLELLRAATSSGCRPGHWFEHSCAHQVKSYLGYSAGRQVVARGAMRFAEIHGPGWPLLPDGPRHRCLVRRDIAPGCPRHVGQPLAGVTSKIEAVSLSSAHGGELDDRSRPVVGRALA
jgi:hypothetical protein